MSKFIRKPFPPLEAHYKQGQIDALNWFISCVPKLDKFKQQRLSALESEYEFSDQKKNRLAQYESGFDDGVSNALGSLTEGEDEKR